MAVGDHARTGVEGRPVDGRFLVRDEATGRTVLIETEGFTVPEEWKHTARVMVFGKARAAQMARRERERGGE